MVCFIFLSVVVIVAYLVGFIKSKSTEWMDVRFTTCLKGLAILTVAWAHFGASFGVEGIQFIAGTGVSIFLICSGYGLRVSYNKHGLKQYWKNRILRVCIPYWIVLFIEACAIYYSNSQIELKCFLLRIFFLGNTAWYLPYIICCYLVFFIVATFVKNKENFMIILAVIYICWFILDSLFFTIEGMPFLRTRQMMCFPFGIFLADNYNSTKRYFSSKLVTIKAVVFIIIGLSFMYITQLSAIRDLPYILSNCLSLLTVFPLALAIIIIATNYMKLAENRFLYYVGIVSYEIFLVHDLVRGKILKLHINNIATVLLYITSLTVVSVLLHILTANKIAIKKKNE